MDFREQRQDFAIVGMSCRLPGGDGLAEYWDLLRRGGSELGPLPADRFNRRLFFDAERGVPSKSYTDVGGVISPRPIDFSQLPLPTELIEGRDVAHLILCEVAAQAIRDAGYDPFRLPNRNVGVYVGHTGGSPLVSDLAYSTIVAEGAQYLLDTPLIRGLGAQGEALVAEVICRTRQAHPGRKPGEELHLGALAASALLAKAFELEGPYMVVDAACASSMQAMAVGLRALRQGRIDMALVGGASYCKSDSLVLFSAAQSVSPTGSCPFGAGADGLVSSEGYVVLAVKTLERAIADGDRIRAVVRGVGISSDGKGKSLWAPRAEGQQLAVQRAYQAGVDAHRLQYIEAHATSTQVGDATELEGLALAIRQLLGPQAADRKIPVGSTKGNVGHTLETAGMAGLVKVVLAMEHGVIPPAVGDGELNRDIDWQSLPFYVPFKEEVWERGANGAARRGAVNAFGIGGLNVHMVLDEFVPAPSRSQSPGVRPPSSDAVPQVHADAMDERAMAIVGAGCIFPGAPTLSAFWDLLVSGRDPKTDVPHDRWNSELYLDRGEAATWKVANTRGGFITDFVYDWRKHRVPPKQIAAANPLQFMLLEAADQALRDAGIDAGFDGSRTGVVVGTMFGGDFSNQMLMGLRLPEFAETLADVLRDKGVAEGQIAETAQAFRGLLLKAMPALLDETGSFTSSTLASRITKAFNLMGGAFAMDAGNCSSLFALQASMDLLSEGTCDQVVCAAGQRSMDAFEFESLSLLGRLAPRETTAAYDANSSGELLGEGCGVVVLKRLADAHSDGDRIRGVIRGIGAARGVSAGLAIEEAARRGLSESGLSADAISLIEASGSGRCETDQMELAALDCALGESRRDQPLHVESVHTQLGCTGGASGMASLLTATLALEHAVAPGIPGFQTPSAALPARLDVSNSARPLPAVDASGYQSAAVVSVEEEMAHVLIMDNGIPLPASASVRAVPAPVANTRLADDGLPDWRILRLVGVDPFGLRDRITAALQDPAAAYGGAPATRFAPTDRMRLAIVADSSELLAKRLRLAAEALNSSLPLSKWEEQGIILVHRPLPRRPVAAIFPGQGSQYAGMLEELPQHSRAGEKFLANAETAFASHGWPDFRTMAWGEASDLGTDVWTTQASMLVADLLAFCALDDLGVQPDFIGGHSFGEFPALAAAGAWGFEEALLATRSRCDVVARALNCDSVMLSIAADTECVSQLLAEGPGDVWMCAINAPQQCVVGGAREAVRRFAQRCDSARLKSRELRVPCAFHTPLLNDTRRPLAGALARRQLTPPHTPLISSVTARFTSDPEELRDNLVRQMTEPVLYVPLIERLYDAGARVFVEVGPSPVLTQLNRRIFECRDDVYCTSVDHPQRSTAEQYVRLQAFVEALDLAPAKAAAAPTPIRWVNNLERTEVPAAATMAKTTMEVRTATPAPAPVYFDATESRRKRRRQAAAGGRQQKASTSVAAVPSRPSNGASRVPVNGHSNGANNGTSNGSHLSPQSTMHAEAHANGSGHANGAATSPHERVVLEIMGEHIRPGVVRRLDDPWRDAVLDAARFLADIAEFFDVSPSELRETAAAHTVREFAARLLDRPGKPEWIESGQVRQLPPSLDAVSAPVTSRFAAPSTEKNGHASSQEADSSEIQAFLVDFVVEQTGYPADIVELDADLESELGIDSIKKAQLFGELGERFDLVARDNLALDQFPTLRHVLAYLQANVAVSPTRPLHVDSVSELALTTAVDAYSGAPRALAPALAARWVQATPLPVELPLAESPGIVPTSIAGDGDVEAFLVNFVVEQTGYPAEIVELDADLEADLGIDSIKKAQLFGEVGMKYGLRADDNLSFDNFPSLRHVRDYVTSRMAARQASRITDRTTAAAAAPESHVAALRLPKPAAAAADEPIEHGDAYEMGFRLGREHIAEIRHLLQRQTAMRKLASVAPQAPLIEPQFAAELRGIAHGAGVLQDGLVALNLNLALLNFLPHGAHRAGRLAMLVPAGVPLVPEVNADARLAYAAIKLPGVVGALGGVNECGLVIGLWRDDEATPALAESRSPWLPTLDMAQMLGQCESIDAAVEFAQRFSWSVPAVLTISDVRSQRLATIRAPMVGQPMIVEAAEWQTAGFPASALESAAADFARSYAARLRGQDAAAWIALSVDRVGVTVARSDEARLAAAQSSVSMALPLTLLPQAFAPQAIADGGALQITRRYVLRLLPTPALSPPAPVAGCVQIIGQSPLAAALRDELLQQGVEVELDASSATPRLAERFASLAVADIPRTLILATACDESCDAFASADQWRRRRAAGIVGPYWLCQQWIARVGREKLTGQCTLVATTALGGDFGLGGSAASAEGGALAGLIKGIHHEFPELAVRIVDVPSNEPPSAAAREIATEIARRDGEIEIALAGVQRFAVRLASAPLAETSSRTSLPRGVAWVVTGGARGVTALVTRELGRRTGAALHLLGTTPLEDIAPAWLDATAAELHAIRGQQMMLAKQRGDDPLRTWSRLEKTIEIQGNLRDMHAAGLDVTYHACDVADRAELARTLDAVRRASGPIVGVIHGAGFEAAARFERKTPGDVERTIAAKNDGAAALMALTADDPLQYFVGFGSTSGRFGGMGQTDYSLANDLLAKQIAQFRRARGIPATTFHWHAWGEVGMAARPESRFVLKSFGLESMPPAEGLAHLMAELEAGLPEPEVLITEPKLCPNAIKLEQAPNLKPNRGLNHVSGQSPRREALHRSPPQGASPAPEPTAPSAALAEFLINFVVEQTGYPPEIVELDADLEADLGIDSIKKAQLFGEIGERFRIAPDDNLSFDDFPTLAHVLQYVQKRVPAGAAGASSPAATAAPPLHSIASVQTVAAPAAAVLVGAALLEGVAARDGVWTGAALLDPMRDVFLREHLLLGRPFLPAVVGLELMAEAAHIAQGGGVVRRLVGIELDKGLAFPTDEPRRVDVVARRASDAWATEIVCDFNNSHGQLVEAGRRHFHGSVVVDEPTSPLLAHFSQPPFPYNAMVYPEDAAMYHGPSLRKLQSLLYQHDGGWGQLVAPPLTELAGARDAAGWIVPSALLDGCFVACAVYSWIMCGQRVEIPSGFQEIELIDAPRAGEQTTLRFFFRRQDSRHTWYDFIAFGDDERPILQCRGFRCVVLAKEDGE